MKIITLVALFVQFFLLQPFIYESMMKELATNSLMWSVFVGIFILATLVYQKLLTKHVKTTMSIMFVLWGILMFLMAFLSVDRFVMLMPLTKINSPSLYLTYTLAGLSALSAIPLAYILKYIGFTKSKYSNKANITSGLTAVLIISLAAPMFVSYRFVFYVMGILLMGLGIYSEKHLEITVESVAKQQMDKTLLLGGTTLVCAYLITLLPDYLFYNIGVGDFTLVATLLIVVGLISVSYPKFSLKQLSSVVTTLAVIIPGYVGYQLALLANSSLGELVKYTDRRFYYIPTHLLIMFGVIILVGLIAVQRKKQ